MLNNQALVPAAIDPEPSVRTKGGSFVVLQRSMSCDPAPGRFTISAVRIVPPWTGAFPVKVMNHRIGGHAG